MSGRQEYNKIYYQTNKQKLLHQQKEYHSRKKKENPIHIAYIRLKARAKEKGLDFDLIESDLIIPEICPILHIPLIWGVGKQSGNSPSFDRIDSNKGYIKGNVAVISQRANAAKSNLSIEDVERLLAYMKGEI